jgi:hypothetical protein
MTDLIAIVSACGLVAVVGLGFVAWERYEQRRLARARLRRRGGLRPAGRRPIPPLERRRAA